MKLKELEMKQQTKSKGAPEKKYYVVYARKSSENEDHQVASISDQLKWVNERVALLSLPLAGKPYTESQSAKAPGRQAFNEMMEEIKSRDDIKGIICWRINRLSRNPIDTGNLQWLLQTTKIDEIITSEKTYKEADADFTMAIEGAQAQRFINDLRKDTLRGMNSKLDKGIAPILAPPGYKNDITKRQGERDIIPDPVQFTLVRKLFEMFMSKNYSVAQLWYEANKLKVKSNRGNIISETQLYQMLRNPFYTGTRFIYRGEVYKNGAHKRMLTDAEFDLIQDIMDARSRPRKQEHAQNLLTGIMRCGECGMMITSEVKTKHYKNGKSQTFVYYRCTKKKHGIKCRQPYLPAKELEEQVSSFLDSITLSQPFADWAIKWLQVMHANQQELRAAKYNVTEQAYQEVVTQIERATEMMVKGAVSIDKGMSIQKELELKKSTLFEELSKMDVHVTEWNHLAIQTFDLVKNIRERFENGSIEQRKTILRAVGSDLTVYDRKVDISIRNPFEYIQKAVTVLNDNKPLKIKDLPEIPTQIPLSQPQNDVLSPSGTTWGGVRGSDPQPSPPQGDALPLS